MRTQPLSRDLDRLRGYVNRLTKGLGRRLYKTFKGEGFNWEVRPNSKHPDGDEKFDQAVVSRDMRAMAGGCES